MYVMLVRLCGPVFGDAFLSLTTVLLSRLFLNLRQRALAPGSVVAVSNAPRSPGMRLSALTETFSGSIPFGTDELDGTEKDTDYDGLETEQCFEQAEWLAIIEADGAHFEDGEKVEQIMEALRRGLNEKNAAQLYQVSFTSCLPQAAHAHKKY